MSRERNAGDGTRETGEAAKGAASIDGDGMGAVPGDADSANDNRPTVSNGGTDASGRVDGASLVNSEEAVSGEAVGEGAGPVVHPGGRGSDNGDVHSGAGTADSLRARGAESGGEQAAEVGAGEAVTEAHSVEKTEQSAAPPMALSETAKTTLSLAPTECPTKPKLSAQPVARPLPQVVENRRNVVRLSAQPFAQYDRAKWKRSRVKDGFLIRRVPGYSIAETEYGVSYLWVLSRKPDRTSADKSKFGFAGYFNWQALTGTGLLCKEMKRDGKRKLAS